MNLPLFDLNYIEHTPMEIDQPLANQAYFQRAIVDRNTQSINLMIRSYYPLVKRITQSIFQRYGSLPYEDSEDLVQNVMMQFSTILINYEKYLGQIPFEKFLTGSIKNIVVDSFRKQLRKKVHQASYQKQTSIQVAPLYEERMDVRNALADFQIQYPDLFDNLVDYYAYDLNDSEVALEKGLTKNQVWRLRQKALSQLQKSMRSR